MCPSPLDSLASFVHVHESESDLSFSNGSLDKIALVDSLAAKKRQSIRPSVRSCYFRSIDTSNKALEKSSTNSKARCELSKTTASPLHALRLSAFEYTPCDPVDHSTPIVVRLCSLLVTQSPAYVVKYSPSTRTFPRKTRPIKLPTLRSAKYQSVNKSRNLSIPSTSLPVCLSFDHGYDPCQYRVRESDHHSVPVQSSADDHPDVEQRALSVSVESCNEAVTRSNPGHLAVIPGASTSQSAPINGSPSLPRLSQNSSQPANGYVNFENFPYDSTVLDRSSTCQSLGPSQGSELLTSSPCNHLSTLSLPSTIRDFFPFSLFNSMQSHAYPTIFTSNLSMVISAPTGSGKTVLFELAILKELVDLGKPVRALLICPTRTLCSQIFADWHHRFDSVGLSVGLLTSETLAMNIVKSKNSNIVIATPEKLDAITRSFKSAFADLHLLFLDEIHTVGSDRGGLVEVLVLRMKTRSPEARVVALSATIGNTDSLAEWLGFGQKAKVLVFGSEYQPVHVEKIVWPCGRNMSPFKFESTLNSHLVQVVKTHYAKKPTLIFCSTRKNCVNTAIYLLKNAPHLFFEPVAVRSIGDPVLANLMARGLAYHHAGMSGRDRAQVESAFMRGRLLVICCTSTLAAGVNLPAFLVIIKGTMCWKNGVSSEYTQGEIMQMAGRAGRPQFESTGKSVVMTSTKDAPRFLSLDLTCTVLESCLEPSLLEHLVTEIYLGTIKNTSAAVKWLSSTFMYTRYLANPEHFHHIKSLQTNHNDPVHAYVIAQLATLVTNSLVSLNSGSYTCTDFGNIMLRHSIQYDTMINMLALKSPLSMFDLVQSLSHSVELGFVISKQVEQKFLAKVAKSTTLKFKGKFTSAAKACLYLYYELEKSDLHDLPGRNKAATDFLAELPIVVKQFHRLTKALLEIFKKRASLMCLLQCQKLWRSINNTCSEGTAGELTQVPEVNSEIAAKLVETGAITLNDAHNLLNVDLRRAAGNAYHAVRRCLDSFPRITVNITSEDDERAGQHRLKLTISIKMLNLPFSRFWNNVPLVFSVLVCESSRLLDFRKVSANLLDENGHVALSTIAIAKGMIECHVAVENFCSAPVVARLGVPCLLQSCFSDSSIEDSLHSQDSSEVNSIMPHRGVPSIPESKTSAPHFVEICDETILIESNTRLISPFMSLRLSDSADCNHACVNKSTCCHICCKIETLKIVMRHTDRAFEHSVSRNSTYTPTPSFKRRLKAEDLCIDTSSIGSSSRTFLGLPACESRSRLPCTPLNTVPPDRSAVPSTVSSTWRLVDIDTIRKSHLRFRGQGVHFGQREEDAPDDQTSPNTSSAACYGPFK